MSNWIVSEVEKVKALFTAHTKATESELVALKARVAALEEAHGTPQAPAAP